MSETRTEAPAKARGKCTGCKFEYQLSTPRSGEYKGMEVVRKHLSQTGPGECEGSRKPPAVELGEATGDADAWQTPGKLAVAAPEGEQRDGVPPVFYASYASDMAECGHPIAEGDMIQADGEGGWRCTDCIVEPEDVERPQSALIVSGTDAPHSVQAAAHAVLEGAGDLPHDRGHETVTHIPNGHDYTDSSGTTWRHGGELADCTTAECVQFRNRVSPPPVNTPVTHQCDAGLFAQLRNCPVHGVQTPVAVAPGGVPVMAPVADSWTAPGPASAAELPPVHGQPEPKRDRWGRYVFNGTSHTRATTFAKAASSTHALSEWRERMVVLGLTMRRDLLAMAHGKHVKRDRTELNSIAAQAKDAAGIKVAANLGTAYHAFSERLDAGLMTLADVPEEYRGRLMEYVQAVHDHGLTTRPEWIERSTAVRADQVAADVPVGGTLDRIFQLPNGELVIGDLKTGSDLSYGWGEIAVQLALYAHGVNTHGLFDWTTERWENFESDYDQKVRTDYGIVIHLPADGSGCTLYRIDLTAGWRRAQVCGQVMAMQKSKDKLATEMFPEPGTVQITQTVTAPAVQQIKSAQAQLPELPPHLLKAQQLIRETTDTAQLEPLYGYAVSSGAFKELELQWVKSLCADRWQELQDT